MRIVPRIALAFSMVIFFMTAQAATVYYCKCDTGSGTGCKAGNDANAGTSPSSPKLNLPSTTVLNASRAGGRHLFCRTGAWDDASNGINFSSAVNATAFNPIVIGAYSPSWADESDPVPRINSTTGGSANNCFRIFGIASNIVFRDFKCTGPGSGAGASGVYIFNSPANITVDNVDISGYTIGVLLDTDSTKSPRGFTLRNSKIHDNTTQGFFGGGPGLLIENNVFDNNGFSGTLNQNHNIYLSVAIGTYSLSSVVVRENTLTRSAVGAGICRGNDIEVHNQATDLVIENNYIDETAGAQNGCYGIEMNPGNSGAIEGFTRAIIRGNAIINPGSVGISVSSINNSEISNNEIRWEAATAFTKFGISNNGNSSAVDPDMPDFSNSYVNNTIYIAGNQPDDRGIYLHSNPAGGNTGLVVSGNVVHLQAETIPASKCYEVAGSLTSSSFALWDNNRCFGR